jgi:hypothetical protein
VANGRDHDRRAIGLPPITRNGLHRANCPDREELIGAIAEIAMGRWSGLLWASLKEPAGKATEPRQQAVAREQRGER